jgi:DNA polymerase-1
MRAEWALTLQSYFGVMTRQAAVKALDDRLVAEFESVKGRLLEEGLVRPDGSRDTKVAMAVAGHAGATVRTTRGFSLAEDVLKDLKLKKGHLLLDYQRYGAIMTTRSRLVSKLRAPLLRTRYEVLVDTGRTSASDPPLQQLPREGGFRECLGADEGNVLVVSDFKGAELVTHAQDCLDLFPGKTCRLAEVLNAGEDPHGYLGADVMKTPYKRFMKLYKGGDKVAGKMRQGAKPGNFGFPVGMGIARFIQYAKSDYGVEVTETEAKKLKQLWLRRFPENQRYLKLHRDLLQNRRRIQIKQLWSGRWRGGCSYTEACNTRFQGRAADGAKLSMWRVAWRQWMEPESDLYGTRQVLFVHDENVIEAPEDQAEVVRQELDEVMIEAFEEVCPDMKVRTDSHITDRYCKP